MLEKILCRQLVCNLEENKLLYRYHFGFGKKRTTYLAIVDFINKINPAIDSGKISAGLFLDLSKAFDTVDHEILLEKLIYYGIEKNEYNWFKSCLSDRKQFVNLNGYSSGLLPITCGVLQGSIPGPVFFLPYVNDANI